MSSTSCSSEYDCYSWQYGSYRSVQTPIYPTMAYPLVYQVQVPPPPRGHKNGERKKNNPNCFVKAFRWYTQEHTPQPHRTGSPKASPDVAGFADWLDSKYEQFLTENLDQDGHRIKLTQTSIIQTESMLNGINQPCMPCATRRFARGKRPINKSLVYLLEPKELPHPGSQCCRPTPTSCCSETVVVCKKYVVKSQSETNVSKYLEAQPFAAAPMQEGVQIKDKHQETSIQSLEKKLGDDAEAKDKPREVSQHSETEKISQRSSKIKEEVTKTSLGNQNMAEQKKDFSKESLRIERKPTQDSVETKSSVPKENGGRKKNMLSKNIYCQCSKESVGIDEETQYEESNHKTLTPQTQVSNSKPVTCAECSCPGCCLHCTKTQTIIKSKRLSIVRTPNTTPKCSKSSSRSNNVSCQCSQEPGSDAHNQHCLECECPSDNKRVCCENRCGLEATQQAITCVVTQETPHSRCSFSCPSRTRAPVTECKTRSTCCTPLVNENVQTSDHSIILDANTIHGYPLFMKIVCADKLYDDCLCQKKLLIN